MAGLSPARIVPCPAHKKNPSQSCSLRRAEFQLAVPLKLRPKTPLVGFVFQTPGYLRGLTEDDYSQPLSSREGIASPPLGSAPVSPLRLGRDGRLGTARRRFSAAPALCARPFPAVFVIAFAMKLTRVYHRFCRLSSMICEKQRKNRDEPAANHMIQSGTRKSIERWPILPYNLID